MTDVNQILTERLVDAREAAYCLKVPITAKARMADIGNKTFPSRLYTATEFPGLAR
jgi:hypothetical protein